MNRTFDPAMVRGRYLTLRRGYVYLNGAQYPQLAGDVAQAMAQAARTAHTAESGDSARSAGKYAAVSPRGRLMGAGLKRDARAAFADIAGVSSDHVALMPSREIAHERLAQAAALTITIGSTVVASRLLDGVSMAIWRRLAKDRHAQWAPAAADVETLAQPLDTLMEQVTESTGLVILPGAADYVGTLVDLAGAVTQVKRRAPRALIIADLTALASGTPINLRELGVDFAILSTTALGGPDCAAVIARNPQLFAQLRVLGANPTARGAARIEPVSFSDADLAGANAVCDLLASFAAPGRRRVRVHDTMTELAAYYAPLKDHLLEGLQALGQVTVLGQQQASVGQVAFVVTGIPAEVVHTRLCDNGVITQYVPAGQAPIFADLGVDEIGGAIVVSLAPHTTRSDLDELLRAVGSLV